MSIVLLHEGLRWMNIATMCAVLTAIYLTGFHRFRWFSIYVLLNFCLQSVGICSGWQSSLYCTLYLWSRPVFMAVRLLATWEVFAGLFRKFTGLKILAQGALTSALLIAVVTASAAIPASKSMWSCPDYQCYFFILAEAERFLSLGLAVFTLVMIVALHRFRAQISHLTLTHAMIWSIRLTITVVIGVIFLWSRDIDFRRLCNIAMAISGISCNAAWVWLVKKAPKEELRLDGEMERATGKLCDELIAFRAVLEETRLKLSKNYVPRFFPRM